MIRRYLIAAALGAAVSMPAFAQTEDPGQTVPSYWQTRAERTDYRETPDYEATLRYLRQLDGGSRWVDLQFFGTSGQGRPMPLLVVSKDRAFTPQAARAAGKTIILVQCGIHAGEIEGKDASLALVRDLTVLDRYEGLLDETILLIVPMLSVDAHERRSPYNRINQNGPQQMGWRYTPTGLNLNRDYMKAEAPEMRALLSAVYTRWWPHLLVDAHTTNGADYRHDLTYDFSRGPACPPSVERWGVDAFEGRVLDRLKRMGRLPAPYITFRAPHDPLSGVAADAFLPRYSHGYAPLHGRAAILLETHMLKPYRVRVRATYDALLAILEELQANPEALRRAIDDAAAETAARAASSDPARRVVTLTTRLTEKSVPLEYRGYRIEWKHSDITGAPVARYTEAPWDTVIPFWRETVPDLQVVQPAGYLVPREWTSVRDRLEVHGIAFATLAQAWTDTVELQMIEAWWARSKPYEGHFPITVTRSRLERRPRSFRAGDLWVPMNQPSSKLAVHLLEARAPDGLTFWNAFDAVLEPRGYAEDYVLEPVARRMMQDDAELARAFRTRVERDTAFANNPAARLDFFYSRSPWADREAHIHPVARALRAPPASVFTTR